MTQTSMKFDAVKAELAKNIGMNVAAKKRKWMLEDAQREAYWIAKEEGTVTADKVYERLCHFHYDLNLLGNAAGSIFRGPDWECVGHTKSERVSNHGREIKIWRLRNGR